LRSGAAAVFANQPEVRESQDRFLADMRRLLQHLPEPARTMRIRQAQQLAVHVAAERERALNRGDDLVPFGAFVSSVLDGFEGWLGIPASDETLRLANAPVDRPRCPRAAR
jgi:hypothetical protein